MPNHQRAPESAYIQYLNKHAAEAAAEAAAKAAAEAAAEAAAANPRPTDLRSRFEAWFNALPEFVRQRPFSMSEIEGALSTQGRYISPVLISLGWRRGRKWTSRCHYLRMWLPPSS